MLIVTKTRRNRHQALRRALVGVNTILRLETRGNIRISQGIEEHPALFEQRFADAAGCSTSSHAVCSTVAKEPKMRRKTVG